MQFYPHLTFDGQCEAALHFYEECLNGKILFLMTYENTPGDPRMPPAWQKKVSHATFAVGDYRFSGSDVQPEEYQKPRGFALQFNLSDSAEAARIFQSLAEGGTIQMPLQETFWAASFGMVIDRFGIPWMINCEKRA